MLTSSRFTDKELQSLKRVMSLAGEMNKQMNEHFFLKTSDEVLEEARDGAALDRVQSMIDESEDDRQRVTYYNPLGEA